MRAERSGMEPGQIRRRFIEEGAVTIDTPLTPEEIAGASAAMNRILPGPENGRARAARTCDYYEPELLEILQHPFFEETAKQVLNAPAVLFFQTAIINAYPQPGAAWSGEDEHVDIRYCRWHWETDPLHIKCSYFLWISDVNEKRAPMMVRPGSHRLLADYRQNDPTLAGEIPTVKGVRKDELPDLPWADPVPLLARAGQVSVLTTSTLHSASTNSDDQPRQCFVLTFHAADKPLGLPENQAAQKRIYDAELLNRFRPERRHLIARG